MRDGLVKINFINLVRMVWSAYTLPLGGYADRTLFVKNDENYLLVVQVYVDDIVFGATIDACDKEFLEEMKKEFEMSMVGELTFFLGLQVK